MGPGAGHSKEILVKFQIWLKYICFAFAYIYLITKKFCIFKKILAMCKIPLWFDQSSSVYKEENFHWILNLIKLVLVRPSPGQASDDSC